MEREKEEFHNSHYVSSRTSIWCPVCGAPEGNGCRPHTATQTLRFRSHDETASGTVPRPIMIHPQWSPMSKDARIPILPARKDAKRPGWTPKGWMQ